MVVLRFPNDDVALLVVMVMPVEVMLMLVFFRSGLFMLA